MTTDKELLALADEVAEWHPAAETRLRSLAAAMKPDADVAVWAITPPHAALDATWVAEPYRRHASADKSAARLERWRNLLVLVPVLLTWLALMYAAYGYRTAVAADASLVERPFLLLWEEGFAGHVNLPLGAERFLTLGTVALIDAVVIGILVLLSWRLNGIVNVAQAKADADADRLEQRVSDLVWQASVALAPRLSPLSAMEQVRDQGSEFLAELRAERERIAELSAERERHTTSLRTASRDFKEAIAALGAVSVGMKSAMTTIDTTTGATATAVAALSSQQTALVQLSSDLGQYSQHLASVVATIDGVTASLTEAAGVLARTAGSTSDTVIGLRDELRTFSQGLAGERATWIAAASSMGAASTTLDQLAPAVTSLSAMAGSTSAELHSLQAALQGMGAELARLATVQQESDRTLAEAFGTSGAQAVSLAQGLQGLEAAINQLETRLGEHRWEGPAPVPAEVAEWPNPGSEDDPRGGLGRIFSRRP